MSRGNPPDTLSASHRITIEDLLSLRQITDVDVAPDGSWAVFLVSENDFEKGEVRTQLHRVELECEPRERQITHGIEEVESPRISPDGRHVAFLTSRPQPGEDEDEDDDHDEDGEPKRQVFALPAEGGEARRLTKAPDGVHEFVWWPDASGVAYLAEAPRPGPEKSWRQGKTDRQDDPLVVHGDLRPMEIWRQPLQGKAVRFVHGDRGVTDFAVSPDGARVAYATNHTGVPSDESKSEIMLVEPGRGTAPRALTGGRGGGEELPRWSPDGRRVSFVAPSDPTVSFSRHDVFVADPAGEVPLVAVTAGFDRTVEDYAWSPDGTIVARVPRGMDSILVRAGLDGATVDEIVGDRRYVSVAAVAAKTGRLALVSEDAASPPELWTADPDDPALRCVTTLNEQTAEWEITPHEVVTWENEGFSHQGVLLRPPGGQSESPPPLVVMVHGGPHFHVMNRLQHYQMQAWAAEGWAVFVPDYRGSYGYGDEYGRASYRDIGGADFRDVLAGVEKVVGLGAADPGRIGIMGGSYGGYLTNWALARSDRFRAGVSLFGIYSLHADFDASEYPAWDRDYLGGYYWEEPALYSERSPATHVREITAPLLLLHGEDDDNTFITNSKALYRALREQGKTVRMVVYPREGHGFQEPSHRLDAFRRTLAWMEEHVLGDAERPAVSPGEEVRHADHPAVRLRLTSAEAHEDLAGRKAAEGCCWLVVEAYLHGVDGVDTLSLEPAGPRGQVRLLDETGRPHRPVGVPLEVLDQMLLLEGGAGRVEAVRAADGTAPSLPFAAVFQVPSEPSRWTLQVTGYPGIRFDLRPPHDD